MKDGLRALRLPIIAFALLALALLVVGASAYRVERVRTARQAEANLHAIAHLKAERLAGWSQERWGDAVAMADQLSSDPATTAWLQRGGAPSPALEASLRRRLGTLDIYGNYADEVIVPARAGPPLRASASHAPLPAWAHDAVSRAMASDHWAEGSSETLDAQGLLSAIGFAAPIRAGGAAGRPVGAVVVLIDPHRDLQRLIDEWPGRSRTGHAVLIFAHGRHVFWGRRSAAGAAGRPAPLEETLAESLARQNFPTQAGEAAQDGADILYAQALVPGRWWHVVVSQDATEVYAPLQRVAAALALGFVALLIAGAGLLFAILWRREAEAANRLLRTESERMAARQGEAFAQAILRTQAELSQDAALVVSDEGRWEWFNQRFVEIWNLPDDIVATRDRERGLRHLRAQCLDPADAAATTEALLASLRDPQAQNRTFHFEVPLTDGRTIAVEAAALSRSDPRLSGVMLYYRDITATLRLGEDRSMLAALVRSSPDAIASIDVEERITSWNPGAERLLGFSAEEMIGRRNPLRPPEAYDVTSETRVMEVLRAGRSITQDITRLTKDRRTVILSLVAAPVLNAEGVFIGGSIIGRDVTEQRALEQEVLKAARADTLTGLSNRTHFLSLVSEALEAAKAADRRVAVLLIDLDRFKDFNEGFGFAFGDKLVAAVAERLSRYAKDRVVLGRLAGDEFGFLLPDAGGDDDLALLTERVLARINEPFQIDGLDIRITASAGLAEAAPVDDLDAAALLSHADIAMDWSKREGRRTWRRFNVAMEEDARHRVRLAAELRIALDAGGLTLAYQPQVDVVTGQMTGVEALARWSHPQMGFVSPGEFVPIAEQTGLASPLGRWVANAACAQVRAWLDAGLEAPRVAINVSSLQLVEPGEFERDLNAALTRYDLEPWRIDVELTESVLMQSALRPGDALATLRAHGAQIWIDDFGTGYSSLDYLRRYPVDWVKIDQNFVRAAPTEEGSGAIIRAVVALANDLGIKVMAEGVETGAHRALLELWGCRHMQGYYFSRPVGPDEIATFIVDPARLFPSAA